MDIQLKDAISIIDAAKTLDWYSIWLWLSIVLPIYYITFQKILPEKQQLPADRSAADSDKKKERTAFRFLRALFSMPKIQPFLLYFSLLLFTGGAIVLVIGQKEKQRIRNLGWTLKNYMLINHFYNMAARNIESETHIRMNELKEIADQYPNEFSIAYFGKDEASIILVDALPRSSLIKRSEKILGTYLGNMNVLRPNDQIPFDSLFKHSNLFTYDVIYELVMDSGKTYQLNLADIHDKNKGFAIVKRP